MYPSCIFFHNLKFDKTRRAFISVCYKIKFKENMSIGILWWFTVHSAMAMEYQCPLLPMSFLLSADEPLVSVGIKPISLNIGLWGE